MFAKKHSKNFPEHAQSLQMYFITLLFTIVSAGAKFIPDCTNIYISILAL